MCSVKPLSARPRFWIRELTTLRSRPLSPPSSSRRRSKSLSLSSCSIVIASIDLASVTPLCPSALPEQARVPAEGTGLAPEILLHQRPLAAQDEGAVAELRCGELAAAQPGRREQLHAPSRALPAQGVSAPAGKQEQLAHVRLCKPCGRVAEQGRPGRCGCGDECVLVLVHRIDREAAVGKRKERADPAGRWPEDGGNGRARAIQPHRAARLVCGAEDEE